MKKNAYQMLGNDKKAKMYLQGYAYKNLMALLDSAKYYFMLYNSQPDKTDLYYELFLKLCGKISGLRKDILRRRMKEMLELVGLSGTNKKI